MCACICDALQNPFFHHVNITANTRRNRPNLKANLDSADGPNPPRASNWKSIGGDRTSRRPPAQRTGEPPIEAQIKPSSGT